MRKAINFLFGTLRRTPLPALLTNIILMLRWRCVIHRGAVIAYPFNVKLGKYSRLGRCKISGMPSRSGERRYAVAIGERAIISDGVVIASQGGYVELGDNISVQDYGLIYGFGGVSIGKDTRIAAATIIVSHTHLFEERGTLIRQAPCVGKGIRIGEDCWIGAGVRVLDDVEIGDRAIVGAGAVVTGDVLPEMIVAGVPAKTIRGRFAN